MLPPAVRVAVPAAAPGGPRALDPGDLPQHLADDVDVAGEAGIGRVGGEEAEHRRLGFARRLADGPRGVDDEAVALVSDHALGQAPASLLVDEFIVPGAGSG